jgi:signal transduction histidine kinase
MNQFMKAMRFSLTCYILSALSCLLLLTWVLLAVISFKTAENDLLARKGEDGQLLLLAIVQILPRPLAAPEAGTAAARYFATLDREKTFAGLQVVDLAGHPVFAVSDLGAPDAGVLSVLHGGHCSFHLSRDGRFERCYAPILEQGRVVGAARLTLSLLPEQERLKGSRHLFFAYFVLDFLLLLIFGSYLLSRTVVRPIRRVLTATRRIADGDLSCALHIPGSTEVLELCAAFNAMVVALREKRSEVEEKVSSLKRANEQITKARGEAIRSEKMASIGLLAAGMAHEIGTPLAAIIGYTGILSQELAQDAETADYLRRIEVESRRIDRIVRGLLDYARPKHKTREEVQLPPLMEKTLELLTIQGALRLLNCKIETEPGVPPVQGDADQLEQLLINLIMNAKDAMPTGGELRLVARREGDEVLIEVIDNGEGISPERLPLIFDPFFTTKEPGKGTGLGLAIAARIADTLGGKITVESELGKGSRFVVRMPVMDGLIPEKGFSR